jgi:TPR repeat protein
MALVEAVAAYNSGNYELAFSEFESADAIDKAEAMFYLGLMYDEGRGVLKDSRKAAELFHQSAQGGYGRGCNAIGICYRDGDGVEKDIEVAIRWFEAGAQLNMAACYRNLGYIYKDKKQYDKAFSYWQKGAEFGNLYCHHGIASLYLNGQGVQPDGVKALEHYAKAQTKDNNTAYGMISVLEKYGLPDGYDPDMIVSYARTAIDNNIITDGTILLRLGRIYQGLKSHNVKGLRPVIGKTDGADVGYMYVDSVAPVSSYQAGNSVHVTGGGSQTRSYKRTAGFIYTTPTNTRYQISMLNIHVENFTNGIDICGLAAAEHQPTLNVKENAILYFYLPNSNSGAVDANLARYLPTPALRDDTSSKPEQSSNSIMKTIISKKVIALAAIVFVLALVITGSVGSAFSITVGLIFWFVVLLNIKRWMVPGKSKRVTVKKVLSLKSELDGIMTYAFGSVDNDDHYVSS